MDYKKTCSNCTGCRNDGNTIDMTMNGSIVCLWWAEKKDNSNDKD